MKLQWLGIMVAVGCAAGPPAAPEEGGTATVRWSPIIDSHVHLAFWPVAAQLPATGIAAVVDLGTPMADIDALAAREDLQVIGTGPMLTTRGGYPLDAWGSDGYGAGCDDAACVAATVDELATSGARVLKIALDGHGLDDALVPGAVVAAHARGMKVAAHALSDRSAALAARAGVDVLAHTPVESLAPETIAAWRGGAVISTLAAFGGGEPAVANLRALRAAGVTILYGTDLGNLRDAGPSAAELGLLADAGLDAAAITAAMTTTPARYWGFTLDDSYLVLDRDPRVDARTLLAPREVWIHGRRVR